MGIFEIIVHYYYFFKNVFFSFFLNMQIITECIVVDSEQVSLELNQKARLEPSINFPIGFEVSKVPRIYLSAILSEKKSSASIYRARWSTGWSVIVKKSSVPRILFCYD